MSGIIKEFENWLSGKLKDNSTVTRYIHILINDIPKKLEIESIFNINDIEYLKDLHKKLGKKGDKDLYEWSKSIGNGVPMASVGKYIDFLTYQNNNQNEKIFDEEEQNFQITKNKDTIKQPIKIKNILLYGASGIGKTHNYKRLIGMIENNEEMKTIFDTISINLTTQNFDSTILETIKEEERIEFITFHQSYSYEDFIEGFRPQKSGNIELEDGIFKSISNRALENLEDSQKSLDTISQKYNFENLLDAFKLYIEDKLSEGEFILKNKATIDGVNKSSFNVGGSVTSGQKLTFDIIQRDYESFKNGEIQDYRDIKSTFESKRGIHGNAPYYFALYHKLKEFEEKDYKQNNDKVQKVEEKNYYLVIDEINRGNISKIFGELITLIEEDKRDSYEVTLPYSKEKFKIPSNLYIIATMNSTDKSIATMDIALRRRFTFIKMKPNSDLVKNTEAQKLMIALNNYITQTRGEDYQLGHSYFMGDIDLEFVIEYKIKPLLEEYFYGDDEAYKKAIDICSPR